MPFAGYASLADVARAHRIVLCDEKFVTPQQRPISDVLRGELDFAENHVAFATSEYAVCENLIYPLLKDVWKSYLENINAVESRADPLQRRSFGHAGLFRGAAFASGSLGRGTALSRGH